MIPTRTHAIIDYVMGALLIIVPFVFNFGAVSSAALWVPVVVGLAILGMSLITAYELSLAKLIPMPIHLGADVLAGLLLAASPWLFGFAEQLWLPHLVLGIAELGIALLTRRHSSVEHGHAHDASGVRH